MLRVQEALSEGRWGVGYTSADPRNETGDTTLQSRPPWISPSVSAPVHLCMLLAVGCSRAGGCVLHGREGDGPQRRPVPACCVCVYVCFVLGESCYALCAVCGLSDG